MLRGLRARAVIVLAVAVAGAVGACTEDESVFRAEVGDCMVRPPEGVVDALDLVSCDRQHLGEVVGIVVHEGAVFPGAAEVSAEAFERCRPLLEEYIGDADLAADYGIVPLSPTEESWNAEIADRESLCIGVPVDLAPSTGSLRDLQRDATTSPSPPTSTTTVPAETTTTV